MGKPDPLPRPTVTSSGSTTPDGTTVIEVKVERDGKARRWTGEGSTPQTAARELVENLLSDPTAAEYIKQG